MTILEAPTVTVPADLIADVCMRAYLAFDGDAVDVRHDLGDGHTLVGHAFSLNQTVTVTYDIVETP
jgi:hypothetical protein